MINAAHFFYTKFQEIYNTDVRYAQIINSIDQCTNSIYFLRQFNSYGKVAKTIKDVCETFESINFLSSRNKNYHSFLNRGIAIHTFYYVAAVVYRCCSATRLGMHVFPKAVFANGPSLATVNLVDALARCVFLYMSIFKVLQEDGKWESRAFACLFLRDFNYYLATLFRLIPNSEMRLIGGMLGILGVVCDVVWLVSMHGLTSSSNQSGDSPPKQETSSSSRSSEDISTPSYPPGVNEGEERIVIPGDGNCLFEAMCQGLLQNQKLLQLNKLANLKDNLKLRRAVVTWMRTNYANDEWLKNCMCPDSVTTPESGKSFIFLVLKRLSEYAGFNSSQADCNADTANDENCEAYLTHMNQNCTWGSASEVYAMSRMFDCRIDIRRIRNGSWHHKEDSNFFNPETVSCCTITLLYDGQHYDLIGKKENIASE